MQAVGLFAHSRFSPKGKSKASAGAGDLTSELQTLRSFHGTIQDGDRVKALWQEQKKPLNEQLERLTTRLGQIRPVVGGRWTNRIGAWHRLRRSWLDVI